MAKTLTGVVSSSKTDKTIVVAVHTRKKHPIYKKAYSSTMKFMAHDEKNQAKEGDKVIIAETRPLSARKRFILVKVVDKALISKDQSVDAVTASKEDETKDEEK